MGGCGLRGENMGTDAGRCAYKHRCACVCVHVGVTCTWVGIQEHVGDECTS